MTQTSKLDVKGSTVSLEHSITLKTYMFSLSASLSWSPPLPPPPPPHPPLSLSLCEVAQHMKPANYHTAQQTQVCMEILKISIYWPSACRLILPRRGVPLEEVAGLADCLAMSLTVVLARSTLRISIRNFSTRSQSKLLSSTTPSFSRAVSSTSYDQSKTYLVTQL